MGYQSLPLVGITGFIMGLVLTLRLRPTMGQFGAESWIPVLVGLTIIQELSSIITGLMVAGKVGSNIGAELSSMRVTEQIDAMDVSGTAVVAGSLAVFRLMRPDAGTITVLGQDLATLDHAGLDRLRTKLGFLFQSLRQMTTKLDTGALWQLLNDKHLPAQVRQSLGHVAAASTQLRRAATDAALLTQGVRQGCGPLGYLLTDKQLPTQLGHAGQQLASTTDTLVATVAGLRHLRYWPAAAPPTRCWLTRPPPGRCARAYTMCSRAPRNSMRA